MKTEQRIQVFVAFLFSRLCFQLHFEYERKYFNDAIKNSIHLLSHMISAKNIFVLKSILMSSSKTTYRLIFKSRNLPVVDSLTNKLLI